jgi:hypothetical protein
MASRHHSQDVAAGAAPRTSPPTRRGLRLAAAVLLPAALLVGCSSDDDSATTTVVASSTSGADPSETTAAPADASGTGDAADAARAEADTAGDPIVADGVLEVPGFDGGTAVYELANVRITAAITDVDCPGGRPVNAQRLAVDLSARLVPSDAGDPNIVADDTPAPIPYVSQLPEVVLIGVGAEDTASDTWFVGISPVSRLLRSMPNTYLRPAPDGDRSTCAILGWEPTDLAEPVRTTEMLALSSAFIPADFDPSAYQVRIGRGDEFAYCWPLDDLTGPAELGRCQ